VIIRSKGRLCKYDLAVVHNYAQLQTRLSQGRGSNPECGIWVSEKGDFSVVGTLGKYQISVATE
jgi:hypothetical protein